MFYNLKDNLPPRDSICFVKLAEYRMKPTDLGVYVKLIDYDMKDGFIPLTEISKWKCNLQKIFKQDKIYPCIVYSFDKDLINLSFMKNKEDERERLLQQFQYAIKINNIHEDIIKNNLSETLLEPLLEPSMYDTDSVEKLYHKILENPAKFYNDKITNYIKSKIKQLCGSDEFKQLAPYNGPINLINYLKDKYSDSIFDYHMSNSDDDDEWDDDDDEDDF